MTVLASGIMALTSAAVVLTASPASAHSSGSATPFNYYWHSWQTWDMECSWSPDVGPYWNFFHACVHHDGCYKYHWAVKDTCDWWFLRDMRASCDATQAAGYWRNRCYDMAWVYYAAVVHLGRPYYDKGLISTPTRLA